MTESIEGLTEAKKRLTRMRSVVSDLDRRIGELEARQSWAEPNDRLSIAREIRTLGDQRVTANALLAETEAAHSEKRAQHDEAVQQTIKNLGRIAKGCSDAAGRFDRALSDAVVALEEIEREASPLVNTLIPNGIRPLYTHPRCINAAIAKAFEERFGRAVAHVEKKSMGERIATMISDARESAAHLRKKEAA